jgi:hypothetical protein
VYSCCISNSNACKTQNKESRLEGNFSTPRKENASLRKYKEMGESLMSLPFFFRNIFYTATTAIHYKKRAKANSAQEREKGRAGEHRGASGRKSRRKGGNGLGRSRR